MYGKISKLLKFSKKVFLSLFVFRIMLHAKNAAQEGFSSICIQTNDTDVVVIATALFQVGTQNLVLDLNLYFEHVNPFSHAIFSIFKASNDSSINTSSLL